DALARARRGNGQDVLGAIVAQIKPAKETQYDATLAQQVRLGYIANIRPAGRAVGVRLDLSARPPGGSPASDHATGHAAESGDGASAGKNVGRLAVEGQPPRKEAPRRVNLEAQKLEPRSAKCRLVSEHAGCPLCRRPKARENHEKSGTNLKAIDLSPIHCAFPVAHACSRCGRTWALVNGKTP